MTTTKNINQRIQALEAKAIAIQGDLMDGKGFEAFNAATTELEKELDAIDKDAGKGLVVGRALSFGVADGSANYIVTKVRKNDVAVTYIPLMDAYRFQGVYKNAKGELCLPRPVAERQCRMNAGLKAMFS